VGVVLGGGTVAAVYGLTRPPALIVTDGSIVGVIGGNLTSITDTQHALILLFNATTYANQSAGTVSTLSIHVWTETYYDVAAGDVYVFANVTVVGRFAANLHPSSLQIAVNETGPLILLQSESVRQIGSNVSYNSQQTVNLRDNDTGGLSVSLINGGGAGAFYGFSYSDWFDVTERPWYNHFLGFRATVTGPFTPAIQVGVLLEIINTNGGTWT